MSSVPPPLIKSLTCHDHHVVETFFSEPWNIEYIFITNFFIRIYVLINTKSNMAAILVSSFSAGTTIKRCPTAFSYGNIDIDLSNLQNILCQKSLIKNSTMSHF